MKIRPISFHELQFAYKLTQSENWDTSYYELKELFLTDPNGFFLCELKDKLIGIVSTVNFENFGFIGNLIVLSEYRKKGFGKKLLDHAINHLYSKTKEIYLDAVPKYINLYKKFSFQPICRSLRFEGSLERHKGFKNLKPMKDIKFKDLIQFDKKYFKANRSKLLKHRYNNFKENGNVIKEGNLIKGYLICIPKDDYFLIGPWIMDPDEKNGSSLLKSISYKSKKKFRLGVLENNCKALRILKENNFKQYSYSIRMGLGIKDIQSQAVYSLAGPDRG
ncbi:MAG: GNAT family N-acetyltransferase [Candidatus Lokiarchaeota archaeon]